MKDLKEKGIANIDYVIATLIFMAGSVAVLALYYNIYISMAKIKIEETIIGYVTEICEMIDLESYENVDSEDEINSLIQRANIPSQYRVYCSGIEHYNNYNSGDDRDVVERISINISYDIERYHREYTISKVKIKE